MLDTLFQSLDEQSRRILRRLARMADGRTVFFSLVLHPSRSQGFLEVLTKASKSYIFISYFHELTDTIYRQELSHNWENQFIKNEARRGRRGLKGGKMESRMKGREHKKRI